MDNIREKFQWRNLCSCGNSSREGIDECDITILSKSRKCNNRSRSSSFIDMMGEQYIPEGPVYDPTSNTLGIVNDKEDDGFTNVDTITIQNDIKVTDGSNFNFTLNMESVELLRNLIDDDISIPRAPTPSPRTIKQPQSQSQSQSTLKSPKIACASTLSNIADTLNTPNTCTPNTADHVHDNSSGSITIEKKVNTKDTQMSLDRLQSIMNVHDLKQLEQNIFKTYSLDEDENKDNTEEEMKTCSYPVEADTYASWDDEELDELQDEMTQQLVSLK